MDLDKCTYDGGDRDTCEIVDTRGAVPVSCRFRDSKSATFVLFSVVFCFISCR